MSIFDIFNLFKPLYAFSNLFYIFLAFHTNMQRVRQRVLDVRQIYRFSKICPRLLLRYNIYSVNRRNISYFIYGIFQIGIRFEINRYLKHLSEFLHYRTKRNTRSEYTTENSQNSSHSSDDKYIHHACLCNSFYRFHKDSIKNYNIRNDYGCFASSV